MAEEVAKLAAKEAAKAFLKDPKYKGYFELAKDLQAKVPEAEARFNALNTGTRKSVQEISQLLSKLPNDTNKSSSGQAKDIRTSLLENQEVLTGLMNGTLLKDIRDREKRAAYSKKIADQFLGYAALLGRGSRIADTGHFSGTNGVLMVRIPSVKLRNL